MPSSNANTTSCTKTTLVVVSVVLALLTDHSHAQTLREIMRNFEDQAVNIARISEAIWQDASGCGLGCEEPIAHDACRSDFLSSNTLTADESVELPNCECDGFLTDPSMVSVTLADGVTLSRDPVGENRRASVCHGKNMIEAFRDVFDPRTMDAVFVGYYNGINVRYPAAPQEVCGTYDPRVRPWYVAGTSGPKNVLMVIDVSESMRGQPLEDAREAALAVVETLTFVDYFGIITFSDTATRVSGERLQVASSEALDEARRMINSFEVDGPTNFEAAFREAFDMIADSQDRESHSPCDEYVVLFLTDGVPTAGLGRPDDSLCPDDQVVCQDWLIGNVSSWNTVGATIFTYAFGGTANADPYVVHQIACDSGGVQTSVDFQEGSNLRTIMSRYYEYYTTGAADRSIVRWVEPYVYAFNGVLGTTVSVPIFDNSVDPPVFIGVVGIDLLMSVLREFGDEETLQEFQRQSRTCFDFEVDQCYLEALRGEATCGVCNTTTPELHPTVCTPESFTTRPFTNLDSINESGDERVCPVHTCPTGLGAPAIAGIVCGSVIVVVIALVVYAKQKGKRPVLQRKPNVELAQNDNKNKDFDANAPPPAFSD